MLTNHHLMSFDKFFFWQKSRNLSDFYYRVSWLILCRYLNLSTYNCPELSEIIWNCSKVSTIVKEYLQLLAIIVQNVLNMSIVGCSQHIFLRLSNVLKSLSVIWFTYFLIQPISKIDQNCPNFSRIVQIFLKLSKSGWGYS